MAEVHVYVTFTLRIHKKIKEHFVSVSHKEFRCYGSLNNKRYKEIKFKNLTQYFKNEHPSCMYILI